MTLDRLTTTSSYSLSIAASSFLRRCGPCQAIKPVYEGLSKEYEGIGFGKVDIDDNQDAAAAFQISSVPTFIFFNGKKPFKAFAGADTAQLESVVKELDEA